MTHRFRLALALIAAHLAIMPAQDADYPDRTMTMIVPFAIGGLNDVLREKYGIDDQGK